MLPPMVDRVFLGWKQPFLTPAVAWLLERRDALPGLLVVTPTAQSGRRLREALAEAAGALLTPQVVTPGWFLQSRDDESAADWMERVAWVEVLEAVADWSAYEALFPAPPGEGKNWASGLARDRRLHFYVRGLIAQARGRPEDAIAAFRSAVVSRNLGYIRIPYELSGVLLAAGRAKEAVPVLQAGLRSGFEGVSLFLTHTELDYRLAQAFEVAGQPDSAAVHYRRAASAWEHADAGFTTRQRDAAGRALRWLGK